MREREKERGEREGQKDRIFLERGIICSGVRIREGDEG